MSKFDDVPEDEDTKIMISEKMQFGDFDVLYQKWFWDGIEAESLIFVSSDVEDKGDNELEAFVRESDLIRDSEITIKRGGSGFTLVNFNFVIL